MVNISHIRLIFPTNLLFFGLIIGLSSCHKDYNSDLQGRWQLQLETSSVATNQVDSIFYSFDNNVVSVQVISKRNPIYYGLVFGKFTQSNDSLFFDYVDWSKPWCQLNNLNKRRSFGIKDSSEHYKIVELNASSLQLKSNLRELIFRKF